MRNWLTRLWKLRSLTIRCLQAGDLGKGVCNSVEVQRPENQGSQWYKFQFKSKACRVRAQCPRAGEDGCVHARESTLLILFRPSTNGTVPTDIGDRQSLLNPSIQMPIASEIPTIDIPRNVLQAI